jgi:hypothetical protein
MERDLPLDSEPVKEVLPRPVNEQELAYSSYAGWITFHFPPEVVIHRGLAQAITDRLKSRNPMLSARGADLHLSFALEDDSLLTQERLALAAQKLHDLLPNTELGEVAIGYVDFTDAPRSTPPYLIDVTDYSTEREE